MDRPNPAQIASSQRAVELIDSGELERGADCIREAEGMGETCARSLLFIGRAWSRLSEHRTAAHYLQRAVELDQSNPVYLLELSLALQKSGEREAAAAVIHQGILIYSLKLMNEDPNSADLYNIGVAYQELGDNEQALDFYEQALTLEPEKQDAIMRRAMILARMPSRHDDALESLERLIKLDHEHMAAHCEKAKLLTLLGEVDQATQLLTDVVKKSPTDQFAHRLLAFAHSISGASATILHKEHLQQYWQQFGLVSEGDGCPQIQHHQRSEKQKLRIGFLFGSLGDHVVQLFLGPFLGHYDQDRFEVDLIELGEHHPESMNSTTSRANALVSLDSLTIKAARRSLIGRNYSIIVDMTGFTRYNGLSLLAHRCAPIQCHYIGFHATTGLDTVDWFIGDDVMAAPDLQDQFVESLWPLPRPWLACKKELGYPLVSSVAKRDNPVLGSFNQYAKIRGETLDYWAAALKCVPEAELHLKNFLTESDRPKMRILDELAQREIAPERITFLPPAEERLQHLECYRTIDVALDTTPWSGATTTFEALLMGVPVVGIYGDTMASRMTCSLLQELGRDSWIADNPQSFAERVAALVRDLPDLRAARTDLRREVLNSRLFDGADLTLHLQNAFSAMAQGRRRSGLM